MIRKNKKFYIILVLIILFGVSVGYAAISRVLTINGNSEVKQNTWDIHFENVKVTNGSVTATTSPTIDNSKTAVNFSFMLDLPGDFYEFTVDAVNHGTIDAMIDSITKTPELTEEQSKYLNYIIEYQNGEQISSKQLVSKNSFVRLKVRVEFRSDVREDDIPTINQSIDLGFILNYVQADGNGVVVTNNGSSISRMSYYSGIDAAITAIGAGTIDESADADSNTGVVGVYTDTLSGEVTVQLQSDIILNEILNIEINLTLDLNGHAINTAVTPAIITKSSNIVIDGSDAGSSITVNAPDGEKGTVLSVISGNLTVNGGTYIANTSKAGTSSNQTQCLQAYNNTTLHVTDAKITAVDTNNGSVIGVAGQENSNIILENCTVLAKSGKSMENRGVSSLGNITLRDCDVRGIADYVANDAGNDYASNSRGVWSGGHLIMENSYVDGSHSGVTVKGTVYVNGGSYNGYGHGGIYLTGTAGPHYFYNAEFNWAPMQEGSVADTIAGTNGAAFYIGITSNQIAYFDNCKFNMVDANGELYKGSLLPFYGIVLRTSGGETNNTVYISNSYVKAATIQMFRGNGTSGNIVYNGVGNDWSKAATIHAGSASSYVDTNVSYAE